MMDTVLRISASETAGRDALYSLLDTKTRQLEEKKWVVCARQYKIEVQERLISLFRNVLTIKVILLTAAIDSSKSN
jgi:hypothetical protein